MTPATASQRRKHFLSPEIEEKRLSLLDGFGQKYTSLSQIRPGDVVRGFNWGKCDYSADVRYPEVSVLIGNSENDNHFSGNKSGLLAYHSYVKPDGSLECGGFVELYYAATPIRYHRHLLRDSNLDLSNYLLMSALDNLNTYWQFPSLVPKIESRIQGIVDIISGSKSKPRNIAQFL